MSKIEDSVAKKKFEDDLFNSMAKINEDFVAMMDLQRQEEEIAKLEKDMDPGMVEAANNLVKLVELLVR